MAPLATQYMRVNNLAPTETDRRTLEDASGSSANTATTAGFSTNTTQRWIQLVPLTVNTTSATPAATGKGWKIDPDTMGSTATTKRVIPPGTWTFRLYLQASTTQVTNDTKCRAYVSVVNGTAGTGTPISGLNGLDSAAVALGLTASEVIWSSASIGEIELQAGDTIIVEYWIQSVGVVVVGQTITLNVENTTTQSRMVLPADIVTRYLQSVTGSQSSSSVLPRRPALVRAGGVTPTPGTRTVALATYRIGTVSPAGTALKRPARVLTGTVTSSARMIIGRIFYAAITAAATVRTLLIKNVTGAINSVGGLTKRTSKYTAGTATPAATAAKRPGKNPAGYFYSSGLSDWPLNPPTKTISGVVRDSGGAPYAGATVRLIRESDGYVAGSTTSAADGTYTFARGGDDPSSYYVVAYEDTGTPTQGVSGRGLVPV